jgi:hypothetical protein
VTRASTFAICFVAVGGCAGPAAIDVSPGEAEDDAAGKADGDTVRAELKATIDPAHIRRARSRLSLLNAQSETRRIWFYDTPSLELFEAGVIVRAREIDGDDDDSTIKLRPFERADLAPEFAALDDMKCELDRDIDSETWSCSLKGDLDEGQIDGVGAGDHQIRTLFDSHQEGLFAAYGAGTTWWDVQPLGPIPARVWTIRSAEVPEKVTAELWYMPDGTQVLEFSMKVPVNDADAGMNALLDFIAGRGLGLSTAQESKTRRALESFTAPWQQY